MRPVGNTGLKSILKVEKPCAQVGPPPATDNGSGDGLLKPSLLTKNARHCALTLEHLEMSLVAKEMNGRNSNLRLERMSCYLAKW